MRKKLVHLSVRTHYSNPDGFKTNPQYSPSKPSDYIDEARDNNVKVVFAEKNNFYNWHEKKQLLNNEDNKYIHAVRLNVTGELTKDSPNHGITIIAKNYEGVKEMNKLAGESYNGRNESAGGESNFYYLARTDVNALMKLSDNVIIIMSGLDNPLWDNKKRNFLDKLPVWERLVTHHKDNVWLGVSSRNDPEFAHSNKYMIEQSLVLDVPLVYVDEIYSHNFEFETVRHLLNVSDNENYEENDSLEMRPYEAIIDGFSRQGVLSKDQIEKAIDETNTIYAMIEDFQLDKSFKYPKMFDNPKKRIDDLIKKGIVERGIHKGTLKEKRTYLNRINHELEAIEHVGAIEYMLLEQYVKEEMRERYNIYPGPGRGSAGASLVSYLLKTTDVDPVKQRLIFERFINKDRISLADQDSDYAPNDRVKVQEFLLEHEKLNCMAIVTFGTMQMSGSIKRIGRALGYDFLELNNLTASVEMYDSLAEIPVSIREAYDDVISVSEKIIGLVTHVSRHAAAIIVSDRDVFSEIGAVKVKDYNYAVSSWDMGQVEKNNYVKLDILGLANIEWIHRAVELAGIPRLHTQAEHIDYNDFSIVDDILEYGTPTLFQLESQGHATKKMLSKKSLDKIRAFNPDITFVELLAIITAVIRPGSASIMEDVLTGQVHDYGVVAINELLSDSYGHLIYQEQTIALIQYAGFTASEADTIRRAISKKEADTINNWIPEFKRMLINKILSEHPEKDQDEVSEMVDGLAQVIIDSSAYSFNKAHAIEYSYITIETAWLRKYYTLEWLTAGFIVWANRLDKINMLTDFARARGINITPAKFRYSKGQYFFNKETNTIYEGTAPIKGNNASVGDILYDDFRHDRFDSFTDFMVELRDSTELIRHNDTDSGNNVMLNIRDILIMTEDDVKELDKDIKQSDKLESGDISVSKIKYSVDKTKLLSLIRLGYFDEFGGNAKLEKVFYKFDKEYKPNNKTFANKANKYKEILAYEESLKDESFSLYKQAEYELFYLGRVVVQDDRVSPKYAFVTTLKKSKTRATATVYNINKGVSVQIKVGMRLYRNLEFDVGDLIEVIDVKAKSKSVLIDGVWQKHPTEKELWLEQGKRIRKTKGVDGK